MLHKIKYLVIISVLILISHIINAQQNNKQEKFVYDEASVISIDNELNDIIADINKYKNYGAKIIIATSSDDEKIKDLVVNGFYTYDLDKLVDNTQTNLNVLVVFNPLWTRPTIIFSQTNCGLDLNRIKLALEEQVIFYGREENQVLFLEYFYNKNYDKGFGDLVNFLKEEIKLKIDEQTCDIHKQFEGEIKSELFPDIEPIEISEQDLDRINTYSKYIEEAYSKFPELSINLIKAEIMVESTGVRTRISKDGARGLKQIMPCTAKDINKNREFKRLVGLKLLQRVKCIRCIDPNKGCSPCSRYESCIKAGPGDGYDYTLDAKTNILAGTFYLSKKLEDCSNLPNYVKGKDITDEEILKCALASYNAGHGKVISAAVRADSTSFDNYKQKFKFGVSREVVPYVTKLLGYYKWLEENYPTT